MTLFRFKNVCIEAMAVHFPETEVTSAELEDKLAPMYERLKIPFGTLEKLSGVKSRHLWDRKTMPSEVATVAARAALEQIDFDPNLIGALINCSVSRDYFEPATACMVHRNLGFDERVMAFDITNACIGFSDGMMTVANMIENGSIKAALLTSGETITRIIEANLDKMLKDETITRDKLLRLLPTFTLGSGAVSYVLCHESLSRQKHKFIGAVARSASDCSELCMGNEDFALEQADGIEPLMETDSAKLIAAASKLGARAREEFTEAFGWTGEDIDHVFCHQVGKQVNEAFYAPQGLDLSKEFTIYRQYGNLVSAALPAALTIGAQEKPLKKGEKVLLTAYGSGLNCRFLGIEW